MAKRSELFKTTKPEAPREKFRYKPNTTYDARESLQKIEDGARDAFRELNTDPEFVKALAWDFETGEVMECGAPVWFPVDTEQYWGYFGNDMTILKRFVRADVNLLRVVSVSHRELSRERLEWFKTWVRKTNFQIDRNNIAHHRMLDLTVDWLVESKLIEVIDYFDLVSGLEPIEENIYFNLFSKIINYEKK